MIELMITIAIATILIALAVPNFTRFIRQGQYTSAGNELVKSFDSFDKATLNAEQAKVFADIQTDAREHAEHVGSNAGNIAHQREHFETLSQEVYDLAKVAGAGQKLYFTNCPMYNNNKGGNWLSEVKDVKNPYMGKAMSTCGSVKEELN